MMRNRRGDVRRASLWSDRIKQARFEDVAPAAVVPTPGLKAGMEVSGMYVWTLEP